MARLNLLARTLDRFASRSPKRARVRAEASLRVGTGTRLRAVRGGGRVGRRGSSLHRRRALSRRQGHACDTRLRRRVGIVAPPRRGICARSAVSPNSISSACRRPRSGQTRGCSSRCETGAADYDGAMLWARPAAEAGAPDAQAVLALSSPPDRKNCAIPMLPWSGTANPPNRIARRDGSATPLP